MGGNNQKSWGLDVGRVDCSLVSPVSALLRAVTWGTRLLPSWDLITFITWLHYHHRMAAKFITEEGKVEDHPGCFSRTRAESGFHPSARVPLAITQSSGPRPSAEGGRE